MLTTLISPSSTTLPRRSRGLPTRQVVDEDWPRPPVWLVTVAARPEPWSSSPCPDVP
jgi:hypothetical protein